MGTWKDFAAFVPLESGREFAGWIADTIQASQVQDALVPGKRLRGYVVTDLQINANLNIDPLHGLQDLWSSPTRNILVVCGLGILMLLPFHFMQQARVGGITLDSKAEKPGIE